MVEALILVNTVLKSDYDGYTNAKFEEPTPCT